MQRMKLAEKQEEQNVLRKLKELPEVLYFFALSDNLCHKPDGAFSTQKSPLACPFPFTTPYVKGIFRPPKFETA